MTTKNHAFFAPQMSFMPSFYAVFDKSSLAEPTYLSKNARSIYKYSSVCTTKLIPCIAPSHK